MSAAQANQGASMIDALVARLEHHGQQQKVAAGGLVAASGIVPASIRTIIFGMAANVSISKQDRPSPSQMKETNHVHELHLSRT